MRVKTSSPNFIDYRIAEDIKDIYEADRFIKVYGPVFGDPDLLPEGYIQEVQGDVARLIDEKIEKYRRLVVESIDLGGNNANFDEEYSRLNSFLLHQLYNIFGRVQQKEIVAHKISQTADYMMLEMRSLLTDVVNSWVKFNLKEIWIMLELGISDFQVYNLYLYHRIKMTSRDKLYNLPLPISSKTTRLLKDVLKKVGMLLLTVSFDFKNKIHQYLSRMNENLGKCDMLTPFVAKFELGKLRERIALKNSQYEDEIFLLSMTDGQLIKLFFKHVYENLDNYPDFDFSDADLPESPKYPSKVMNLFSQPDFLDILEQAKAYTKEIEAGIAANRDKITEKESVDAKLTLDDFTIEIPDNLLNAIAHTTLSEEEAAINEFLAENPEIDEARKAKNSKIIKKLSKKKISEVKYVVNPDGQVGKYIRFEGEESFVLIRVDKEGNYTVSKATNRNQWFQINVSGMDATSKALDIITSKKEVLLLTQGAVSGVALSAGSGALGVFIYKLVEGREDFSTLSKRLIISTGGSFTINILLGTVPNVAIALAWVVGIKAISDLQRNKLLRSSTKAKMITGVVARTGASIGITVGSAVVGQALIPIPILGSFIGGMIGGFSAAAIFGAYDKLLAKKVSMEVLYCYTAIVFNQFEQWEDCNKKSAEVLIHKRKDIAQAFLTAMQPYLTKKYDIDAFMTEMKNKVDHISDVVEELYSSIAKIDKGQNVDKVFENSWKTMITVCFLSYYYFLLNVQLNDLVNTGEIMEGHKVQTLTQLECLLEVDVIVKKLIRYKMNMFGKERTLAKVCTLSGKMAKDGKLVTLFRQSPEKIAPKKQHVVSNPNESPQLGHQSEIAQLRDDIIHTDHPNLSEAIQLYSLENRSALNYDNKGLMRLNNQEIDENDYVAKPLRSQISDDHYVHKLKEPRLMSDDEENDEKKKKTFGRLKDKIKLSKSKFFYSNDKKESPGIHMQQSHPVEGSQPSQHIPMQYQHSPMQYQHSPMQYHHDSIQFQHDPMQYQSHPGQLPPGYIHGQIPTPHSQNLSNLEQLSDHQKLAIQQHESESKKRGWHIFSNPFNRTH